MSLRDNIPYENSFEYKLFLKHFQETNNLYWTQFIENSTIKKLEKDFKKKYPDKAPIDFFIVSDKYDKQLPQEFSVYEKNSNQLISFIRGSILVYAVSNLEFYIRNICLLALESRPGLIFKQAENIDGLLLLKRDSKYGQRKDNEIFMSIVNSITEGEWNKRISNYQKIFGDKVEIFMKDVSILEFIRNYRNNFAHNISRKKETYGDYENLIVQPVDSIAHETLIRYLKIIHNLAKQIDKHLYTDYVGSYELLKYYVKFNKNPKDPVEQHAVKFRKFIGFTGKESIGDKYFKEIIKYYESL